jgi:hypothetical protein
MKNDENGLRESNLFMISTSDGKMKFSFISADALGNPQGPYSEKIVVWENFETFTKEWNDKAPQGMGRMQFNGGFFLAISESEKAFMRGAMSGIMIALAFSFIILLIST